MNLTKIIAWWTAQELTWLLLAVTTLLSLATLFLEKMPSFIYRLFCFQEQGPSPSQDFNEVDFTQYLKNSCNHKTIKERMPFEFLPVDESFIHAKIYVADDSFAAIGSANLTKTGMWESVEHIVILDDGPDIQK